LPKLTPWNNWKQIKPVRLGGGKKAHFEKYLIETMLGSNNPPD